jgi:succinoglycan biosynthesis transport protein ExoP
LDMSVGSAFVPGHRDRATLRVSQVIKVLRRHVVLIGVFTIAAAALGYFYARSVPKTYTASAAIAIEGDRFAIPELQGALRNDNSPDPMPFVRTEVQALTARSLVEGVIGKLGLDHDPEFNPALRPPSVMDRSKAAYKSLLPSPPGGATAPGPDESVLASVNKALSIFQDNRSLVISIGFTSQDPRLAASFLNTLIADYLQSRSARRADANRHADDVLVQRINQVKSELDGYEKQMSDLRSRSDIVALRAGSEGQQQVEELATAAARASVDRAQLEATWNRATALAQQGSSEAMSGVLDSPTVSRLRDQESEAAAKVADLSSRYGSNYPTLRGAIADLAAVRKQLAGEINRIVTALGAQVKVARAKEADIQNQLANARKTGVLAVNAQAQLDQLQKEADTRRTLYQTLLQSEQQTVAQPTGAETPDIRVLSNAVPPGMPSGPNTKIIVGTGGLTGLMLGCLLAMLRLHTVDGFDSATDVTDATGWPVLTSLPEALMRKGMAARVLIAPNGSEVQAMRTLRDRVRFAAHKGAPRSVLFATILRRGDTAELAAAFARTAAAAGENVLLVEANLGSPALGRLLSVQSDGLTRVLEGDVDWRAMAAADPFGPLDLLLTDQHVAGSTGLLSGVTFQNVLVEARQYYDLVVLSGPPADTETTAALVPRVDIVVLALDGKAGNPAAQRAMARLAGQAGNSTLTAILAS